MCTQPYKKNASFAWSEVTSLPGLLDTDSGTEAVAGSAKSSESLDDANYSGITDSALVSSQVKLGLWRPRGCSGKTR